VTTDLAQAVAALRAGRLAVLPTETVYGLGADAAAPAAVARVYAVKGRPADHPVIVHLADVGAVDSWAVRVPEYARLLARRFWPGPLTLVLPRAASVGDHVTGGQATVGLRVPDHPLTLAVLREVGGVAAPSANRFGRVSPTSVPHVLAEVGSALVPGLDVVLDGGPCPVGVESTIVDATGAAPRLLRPGAVSVSDVSAVGGVPVAAGPATTRAPGTLPAHYAPDAQVRVVAAQDLTDDAEPVSAPRVGLLAPQAVPTPRGVVRLAAPQSVESYARGLYAAMREADALGLSLVLAVAPAGDGLAAAVRDRLRRAEAGS
jgi:L-threonylcarbamoyladenylate synthase